MTNFTKTAKHYHHYQTTERTLCAAAYSEKYVEGYNL